MADFCDIRALQSLLNPPKDNSDSEEELVDCEEPVVSNEIGKDGKPVANKKTKTRPYDKLPPKDEREEYKDFDDYDEKITQNTAQDWKKTPKYDIIYKQKVTAEDVFLQLGARTPSTASCEDMVVTIELPGEKMANIDAKVLKESLEIISPRFYLKLTLPHPVDPQQGSANWDKTKDALIVTLRMDREFDFVNF